MKQITTLTIVLGLILSLNGMGQTSPSNWKTVTDPKYSIQYPDTFDIDQSGQTGMNFIILSKQTSPQDLFRENVNLIIQNLAEQNIDLDMFVEISEKQINEILPQGELLESKRMKSQNREFHKLSYIGRMGEIDLKWLQYYWVENDLAFVLTLTCEENQYNRYVNVGEKIMSTFKIK